MRVSMEQFDQDCDKSWWVKVTAPEGEVEFGGYSEDDAYTLTQALEARPDFDVIFRGKK